MIRYLNLILFSLVSAVLLTACSSTRLKPAPLVDFVPSVKIEQIWSASVDKGAGYFFNPFVVDNFVYSAGNSGEVAKFDLKTGRNSWRIKVNLKLVVGISGNSKTLLVGGERGFLIVLDQNGVEKWRRQLSSEILSLPGLAGDVVVAQTIDNRLSGYDLATGRRLWIIQRSLPPLLLRDSRGVLSTGNISFVSFPGSKLLAVSSNNGNILWENKLVEGTGSNELERLTAIVGMPVIIGDSICIGSYQGNVMCMEALNGNTIWEKKFSTASGIVADGQNLFTSDERSVVYAFITNTGLNLWQNDKMKNRQLSRPIIFDKSVAFGDSEGYVHVLSRDDGSYLTRLDTNSSGVAAMIMNDKLLIVRAHNGNLYAFNTQP